MVRRSIDRFVLSAVNAFVHLREGTAPAGGNAAARDDIYRRDKLTLSRIRPISDEEFELGREIYPVPYERLPVPVVIVPPLMVRPYVYDLRPDHSFVRTLRNAHFDVFVIDFGVPDRADLHTRLEDYVLDWIPTCVDEALKASGAKQVSLLGYSFGGVFTLLHAGTHQDERVKNLVTIGAPIDFAKMVAPHWLTRLVAPAVAPVTAIVGNIPGAWSTLGFKLMGGPRTFTRWVDFAGRLYDTEYLRSFDAVNTWVNDLIPYPRDAFKQVVRDVVAGNRLIRDELVFGGKRCEISKIRQSVLGFAGRGDNIATPKSTHALVDHVGSHDKMLVEVSGGHVGIIAGSTAPREVWAKTVEWLTPRSR